MVARTGPGRRWVPMYWLVAESAGDGWERLPRLSGGQGLVAREYEYRVLYDAERGMWRVDRRRTAAGG